MNDEIRDGFLVTKERKGLWNVQKEILDYFDNFCTKHKIRYFVADGTLLGTIRHKGYIPWDDDIDLYMFRDDYNKLLSLENKFSNNMYFLQSSFNDKIVRNHIQIRKNNTTCLLKGDFKAKYHCGIFVDIFPMDKVPSNKGERIKFYNHVKRYYNKITMPTKKAGFKKHFVWIYNLFMFPLISFLYKLKILLMGGKLHVLKRFDSICSKYNKNDSKYVTCVSFNSIDQRYYNIVFDINDFRDIVELPFEDIKVKCPVGYDSILKNEYDDYMVFKVGENAHGNMFFDIDKDYKYYLKKSRKEFINLFKPF